MSIETSSTSESLPPIPARMLNEFVYCPRLGYLMWVEAEFAESADTVEGKAKHQKVDRPAGTLPEAPEVERPSMPGQSGLPRSPSGLPPRSMRLRGRAGSHAGGLHMPCWYGPATTKNPLPLAGAGFLDFIGPCCTVIWRRSRDSNPGWGHPHNGFRDRPVQPLRHSSVCCPA